MASKSPPPASKGGGPPPISIESDDCDPKFLDDLVAAIRLKACLIGRGVDVEDKILDELAEFHAKFSDEIEAYDKTLGALNAAQPPSKSASPPAKAHEPETVA